MIHRVKGCIVNETDADVFSGTVLLPPWSNEWWQFDLSFLCLFETQHVHLEAVGVSTAYGFPSGSVSKESSCNVGDLGSIPGLGRYPGEGHGNALQYSCLENPHGQRCLVGCSLWGSQRVRYDWLSTQHKPSLKDFEHNLTSMWNECNCMVVWTLFGIALLWDWIENWFFPVLWPQLNFQNFLTFWVQHSNSIIF